MTNLYDILQTLVNIKNKDLKSKTAIPPAALRVLKQEPAALNQTAFRTRQNSGESSIKSWDEMLNMKSNENYAIPAK
uniref:Uncharacterized protein n=1 Tax=Octopus bimaculoides TaxID=37653 RepID=A0A0L8IEY8_OCTBM